MRINSSRRFKNAYQVYEHKKLEETLYGGNAKLSLLFCERNLLRSIYTLLISLGSILNF